MDIEFSIKPNSKSIKYLNCGIIIHFPESDNTTINILPSLIKTLGIKKPKIKTFLFWAFSLS